MLAIAKALQLEAVRRRASVLSCLVFRPMANFVMCMHTNCYFQLLIWILTLPLDSAIQISYREQ